MITPGSIIQHQLRLLCAKAWSLDALPCPSSAALCSILQRQSTIHLREMIPCRAYDMEAVQTWGRAAHTNLNIDDIIASLAAQRASLACGPPHGAANDSMPTINGLPASSQAGQRQRSSKYMGVSIGPAGKWLAQVSKQTLNPNSVFYSPMCSWDIGPPSL